MLTMFYLKNYCNIQIFKEQIAIAMRSNGGGERVRTDDLLRARQALSQLSYTPMQTL